MKFVLLAAGKSSRIFKKIKKPKCLLEIGNISLIEHLIKNIKSLKHYKISVVVGFKSEIIKKNLRNSKG